MLLLYTLLLLRGALTAAICNAGVASNCEGAGSVQVAVVDALR